MLEFFGSFVIDCLLSIPGAAIRWLFLGRRKSYKELLKDVWLNAAVASVFFMIIGGVVFLSYQQLHEGN